MQSVAAKALPRILRASGSAGRTSRVRLRTNAASAKVVVHPQTVYSNAALVELWGRYGVALGIATDGSFSNGKRAGPCEAAGSLHVYGPGIDIRRSFEFDGHRCQSPDMAEAMAVTASRTEVVEALRTYQAALDIAAEDPPFGLLVTGDNQGVLSALAGVDQNPWGSFPVGSQGGAMLRFGGAEVSRAVVRELQGTVGAWAELCDCVVIAHVKGHAGATSERVADALAGSARKKGTNPISKCNIDAARARSAWTARAARRPLPSSTNPPGEIRHPTEKVRAPPPKSTYAAGVAAVLQRARDCA